VGATPLLDVVGRGRAAGVGADRAGWSGRDHPGGSSAVGRLALPRAALDDQSAFIASLGSSGSARMRDVLGTIQADQDAIVRAGSRARALGGAERRVPRSSAG
jgi:hypothetical protein